MTNRKALLSKVNFPVKPDTVTTVLLEQNINPEEEYTPQNEESRKGIDLALAALIFVVALSPESVKELDFQLTQRSIDGLLKLRRAILKKWGMPDEMEEDDTPIITSVSDLW
ncbi:DUF6706 family protein [Sphingobacterium hungaricum]|uniref:Uncharacterized protein n=1 Tax=Sphingobacterium hungaricum TaxID=2082723 RepID=A0A928YNY4_9SPHI|nr:DUF6706 family protein [Sphingobacterium hungaricum]MBE8712541.1 hypothetical protein [Sphingobacterium hungaricum]